jgi:TusA-related sulfurtransferase
MSRKAHVVDARGLSCPQPILVTRRAIEGFNISGDLTVLVDTATSCMNVTRYAENAGWRVTSEPVDDYIRLCLKKL